MTESFAQDEDFYHLEKSSLSSEIGVENIVYRLLKKEVNELR